MTGGGKPSPSVLVVHGAETASALFPAMRKLYAEHYASSDDWDNDREMIAFTSSWPMRLTAPEFALVAAYIGNELVGFTFGHSLTSKTRWWSGMLEATPTETVEEWPGRTFALIEIITKAQHRRHGIAKRLHAHLLAELTQERVTLLVRIENATAYEVYTKWSYLPIGRIQPFSDGPIFTAMIKPLAID